MQQKTIELDVYSSQPRNTIERDIYERIYNNPFGSSVTLYVKSTNYISNPLEPNFSANTNDTFYIFISEVNENAAAKRFVIKVDISTNDVPENDPKLLVISQSSPYTTRLASESEDVGTDTVICALVNMGRTIIDGTLGTISSFRSQQTLAKMADKLFDRTNTMNSDIGQIRSDVKTQIANIKSQLYPVGIIQWIKSGNTPSGLGLPGSWTSLDPICIATNANTSVGLDVTGAQFKDGTNIELWTFSSEAQKWRIRSASGTFLVPWLRTA